MKKYNKQTLDIIVEKTKAHWVSDNQWSGYCLSHDDQTESLSIGISKESGNILLKCHAGCDLNQICGSLVIQQSDLFPNTPAPVIKEIYDYRDSAGELVFQVVRREPKDFRQRRPDGKSGWIWNTQGTNKPLYQLPELISSDPDKPVFIPEGEKDVLRLQSHDLTATCNAGGAGKWEKEYNGYFRNKDICILPDNDPSGKKHAELIASSLSGIAKSIKILSLPNLLEKGDVSDWFDIGGTAEKLIEIATATPLYHSRTIIKPCNIADFLQIQFPDIKSILDPWLQEKGLAMIYGPRGRGKTFLCDTMAYAIASGNEFLGWQVKKPHRVLLVDGEMPASVLQKRLALIVKGFEKEPPSRDYLQILSSDMFECGIPDLASPEGQRVIENNLAGINLLILDNLSTLFRRGAENDAESWAPIQEWILSLRRKGIAMLMVHHAGKAGNQRGTSKREDVLDTVISLRNPPDYIAEEGCRFEIHFDKARHLHGDDIVPFEAQMSVVDNAILWTRKEAGPSEMETIIELLQEDKSQREISKELGISLGKVNKLCQEARAQGKIAA